MPFMHPSPVRLGFRLGLLLALLAGARFPQAAESACQGLDNGPYASERIGGAGSGDGPAPCHRFESGTGGHEIISRGGSIGGFQDDFILGSLRVRGDQAMAARIHGLDEADSTSRAGVMIRAGFDSASRNVFLGLTPGGGFQFLCRRKDGDSAETLAASLSGNASWVKLEKRGSGVRAYLSSDGLDWMPAGSVDSLDFGNAFHIGLAACGKAIGEVAEIPFGFSGVTLVPLGSGGFLNQAVGDPPYSGALSGSAGTFTLTAAGRDIYGSNDQFQYACQRTSGDRTLIARVDSLDATDPWAKAGLMFRTDLEDYSPNVYLSVTPSNGVRFQYRPTSASSTRSLGEGGLSAPQWLKLEKKGNRYTGFRSPDGENWIPVGSATLSLGNAYRLGLAATSHAGAVPGRSYYSHVQVTPTGNDAFDSRDIGGPALPGAYAKTGSVHAMRASGRDIWAGNDQFRFAYRKAAGDHILIARVDSLDSTHSWAKAGIMIRASLGAGSANAMVALTASNGVLLQSRARSGAASASPAHQKAPGLKGPRWLKLEKRGSSIRAWQASDGVDWAPVGGVLNLNLGSECYFGLAATSHTNAAAASASFSEVLLVPAPALAVVPLSELGWNDSLDRFAMDRTEVTEEEFLHTLSDRWGPGARGGRRGSLKPMTGVTWADALLYANARSQRDGLEPVYLFSQPSGDPLDPAANPCADGFPGQGCMLDGDLAVTARQDAYGYRLPTDPEWEFAARLVLNGPFHDNPGRHPWSFLEDGGEGGVPEDSRAGEYAVWNAPGPSDVASRLPTQEGLTLFDICGNAGEWTFGKNVRGGDWTATDPGSLALSSGVPRTDPAYRDTGTGLRLVLPTIRKDAAALSRAEKERFLHAIFAVKALRYPGYAVDVPEAQRLSWWDWFAMGHTAAMMPDFRDPMSGEWMMAGDVAHRNPSFLVWHREFLNQLELALQTVDPRVTVPFIRWGYGTGLPGREAAEASLRDVRSVYDTGSGRGLLGFRPSGNGRDSGGLFDPGFAAAHARDLPLWWPLSEGVPVAGWTVPTYVNNTADRIALLRRDLGFQPENVDGILANDAYDDFRFRVEAWPHNAFHNAMGGDMATMWAPMDPLFYLHHGEVDRLWTLWQETPSHRDPADRAYVGRTDVVGRDTRDPIWPFSGGFFRPMDNVIGRFTGVYPTYSEAILLGDVIRRKRPLYSE